MDETIATQVRQIAADLFQVPLDKVTPASSPETLEAWDSVGHLNLVLALESQLGISLAPEDIEKMKTIADVIALVQERSK